jgi:hypothetical protein
VGHLRFDVTNAKTDNDKVTADLALFLTIDAAACDNQIRYPVGVQFRGAQFNVKAPQSITLAPPNGVADIAFDSTLLSQSLSAALPLPLGFTYSGTLEAAPTVIDGTVFSIQINGPGGLGTVANGKWQLDRRQPDLGLRAFAESISHKTWDTSKARDIAAAEFRTAFHSIIDGYLEGKVVDAGPMVASRLRIDWDRWDRGDQQFSVELAWPGADAEVEPILPQRATLRFNGTTPKVITPPIDAEALRSYLGLQIAKVVPDAGSLDEIMRRFGEADLKTVPAGWLRLRNVVLTQDALAADVAFAIGSGEPQWLSITAPLPLKVASFTTAISALAKSAETAAAQFAAQVAEQAALEAVANYFHDNPTHKAFGLSWTLAPKTAEGNKLPPKPVVMFTTADGVGIDGVLVTIENGTPVFDYSAATLVGIDALASKIADQAGLSGGDLSLAVSGLQFSGGKLTGTVAGDFLGTAFTANFEIGPDEVDLKLPGARTAIVASLQQALDGQEVAFSGLRLHDFTLCPPGIDAGACGTGGFGADVSFDVTGLFSGTLSLAISPKLKIESMSVDPSSGIASVLGIFEDGPVSINVPTEFSPLKISGTIKLSNLFDVIPLPDVPFEWSSATGKVSLGMPTVIAIDTDIIIPPWLDISQIRIPIGKTEDGTVTTGMRLTVGEHYVQYILNIDGTMQANPRKRQVKVAGKLSILSLPLYQVDGTVDFDKKEIVASAKTVGLLKAVIPQESIIKVLGEQCLASEDDNVHFIFFRAKGSLVIQVPPSFCGAPLAKAAAACGLTSAGGLCLHENIDAGSLGDAQGTISAGFDLNFSVEMDSHINVLEQDVGLGLSANTQELNVKVRAEILGAKIRFGLTFPQPDQRSNDSAHEIIEQVIEALLHPNLQFPLSVSSVSSGSDHGSVTVEADNDGGEPTMSKMTPDKRNGQPVQNGDGPPPPVNTGSSSASAVTDVSSSGQAEISSSEMSSSASASEMSSASSSSEQSSASSSSEMSSSSVVPPIVDTSSSSSPTEINPIFAGTVGITFDPDKRLRAIDSVTGVQEVSDEPVDPGAVAVLRGACVANWFTNKGGSSFRVGAADADGVVISTAPECGPAPNCGAGQFCALGLRNNSAGAGTIPFEGKFHWPNADKIGNEPARLSELELGLLTGMAGAQLFPPQDPTKSLVDPAASWICAVLETDATNCRLALEHTPDNRSPAFVSKEGSIVAIEDGSLAALGAQGGALGDKIFGRQVNEAITVYGSGTAAWLVGLIDPGTTQLEIIRTDATELPIAGMVASRGSPTIWIKLHGRDPVLDAAADWLAQLGEANLKLTDLGDVDGARRIMVDDGSTVWLLSPKGTGACVRAQSLPLPDKNQPDLALITDAGPGTVEKLVRALTLSSDDWRQMGFTKNPAIAFFGSDCTATF